MQVSSTSRALQGLAQTLRLSFQPDFTKRNGLNMIQSGFLSFSGDKANIRPDATERQKYNNFATLDHRMGERYSLRTEASITGSRADDRRMGVVANYVDSENFVAFEYNAKNRRVQAIEYIEGRRTILATKTLESDPGENIEIQLDRNQRKFDYYINGEKQISVKSQAQERNAKVGLMAPDTATTYSNLKVWQ